MARIMHHEWMNRAGNNLGTLFGKEEVRGYAIYHCLREQRDRRSGHQSR
jgi:hypothetical protein